MVDILLQIGCDGGDIKLKKIYLHGVLLFEITRSEFFQESTEKSKIYLDINDAWRAFKVWFPQWHQLYLVNITAPMIDILKTEYIAVTEKNEFTMDRWLQQLTGKGIGF